MKKLFLTLLVILSLMLLASCDLSGLASKLSPDKCAHDQHDYVEAVTAPTCTEGGYTKFTCSRCGKSYVDKEVKALGHSYEAAVTAPTCIEGGFTTNTCSVCSDSYVDNETEPSGHNYEAVITPPTCEVDGYTTNTCSACGDVYESDTVEALTHRFNDSECLNCGGEEKKDIIVADTEWYDAGVMVHYIDTAEKLCGLAEIVNSGTDISHQSFRLSADIDLGYAEWIPIGTAEHPFKGIFDGNNHIVYGLKICASGSYTGLFGKSSGTISNLSVLDATIYAKSAPEYLGILCGYSENKIENVTVSGYLDAEYSDYVGGVSGYSNAIINDSASSASICGGSYVGGICGSVSVSGSSMCQNLINNGKISGGDYTGGIFGNATANIGCIYSNLVNNGEISGGSYTGGIMGSSVSNGLLHTVDVVNTGSVSGEVYTGGVYGYAKGKVGSMIDGSSSYSAISGAYYVGAIIGKGDGVGLTDCDNTGSTVTATSYVVEGDNFYVYLGGYAGYVDSVANCINAVDISYNLRGSRIGGIAGYVKSAVSGCENTASISGTDSVGGIVGVLDSAEALNILSLKNSGSVTGNVYIGGIIGRCASSKGISLGHAENTGAISGKSYTGGIVGEITNKNTPVSASDLKNTGSVNGGNYTGGLFGYVGGSTASCVRGCTSSATIVGTYYVGGLIGMAYDVEIASCSNEGSSVTATDWVVSGDYTDVYLGGYVGLGYKVSDCVNNVEINYTGIGRYVGGIAGCVESEIKNCENNANIISAGSEVGGIAGELRSNRVPSLTYSNLTNNGNIEGASFVGGIAGSMYKLISPGSATYNTVVQYFANNGAVSAKIDCAGGIIGRVSLDNTYNSWIYGSGQCRMVAENLENSGAVSGTEKIGELFGAFWTDGGSTVTTYTVTGSVTVNGTVKEESDVGESTNLTLEGRTCTADETEDEADGETTEGSEGENIE